MHNNKIPLLTIFTVMVFAGCSSSERVQMEFVEMETGKKIESFREYKLGYVIVTFSDEKGVIPILLTTKYQKRRDGGRVDSTHFSFARQSKAGQVTFEILPEDNSTFSEHFVGIAINRTEAWTGRSIPDPWNYSSWISHKKTGVTPGQKWKHSFQFKNKTGVQIDVCIILQENLISWKAFLIEGEGP